MVPPVGSEPEPLSLEQVSLIREHLREVVVSPAFAGSKRAPDFLQLLVEHSLAGRKDALRERMIGAEMFGRPVDYDTANDAVVRVKASEIRRRLAQYYGEMEGIPAVRIDLPVGGYVPKFIWATAKTRSVAAGVNSSPASDSAIDSPAQTQPTEGEPIPLAPTHPSSPRFSHPPVLTVSAAGILLLLAAVFFSYRAGVAGAPDSHIRTIAILPLLNLSGDPSQDYLADGMTEELTAELGQAASLRVISRTSTTTYRGTKKTLPEIARELNVDDIVEGSIGREKSRIRITTQLIDAKSDQYLWAHTYDCDVKSVLDLQSEVAAAIAAQISSKLTPAEKQRLSHPRHANPEAVDLYLQGMQRTSSDDHKGAAALFQQAIAKDSNYAQAHAALSFAYWKLGDMGWMPYAEAFSEQRAEALKAIDLDDSRPEPHLEVGLAALSENWDFVTTEREFKRALQLNPNASAVHWAYAIYLERAGRLDQSVAEARLAAEIDPVSSFSHSSLAYTLYCSRQYTAALAEVEKGVSPRCRQFLLGLLYAEMGQYENAIQDFKELGDAPHALGHLGNVLARAGHPSEARETIAKLNRHITQTGIGRYEVGIVYAGLKEKDAAFKSLEQALSVRDKGMTFLLIDPCLDPLRSDPRFQRIVQRVGFPDTRP